jgi:hypothetical protein
VDSDCRVSFKGDDTALCVESTDGGFLNDMSVDVVKRLLENRFGCSADSLPVVSVWKRTKKC